VIEDLQRAISFVTRPRVWSPIVWRSMGLATKAPSRSSHIEIDQKASTGGKAPGTKRITYSRARQWLTLIVVATSM
jgi:hypothetical protein